MEIGLSSANSVKLKGKSATLITDPTTKVDADIIIATQPLDSLNPAALENVRLIISGPGEYEAGGIGVTGKDVKGELLYHIFDNSKIMFTTSNGVKNVPDDEEYDALLIKVVGVVKEDDFASINAKCVVLYGDIEQATVTGENVEKTSKVSLKKTAEITGKIFLLS